MKTNQIYACFAGMALLLPSLGVAASPEAVLQAADEIRNPSASFSMKVKVTTGDETSIFEVSTKGKDKTLVKTLAPARDQGRDLLMLEENMWAYVPNLKRAVRVSLNAKLTGQAANGDIARMRWAGDYDASFEKETPEMWTLKLVAKKKGLTYEKIRAFVDKKTMRPVKAEYLSLADLPLKYATFGDYKKIAGGIRPTKISIAAAKGGETSVITIQTMTNQDFPDSTFQRESLGRN